MHVSAIFMTLVSPDILINFNGQRVNYANMLRLPSILLVELLLTAKIFTLKSYQGV